MGLGKPPPKSGGLASVEPDGDESSGYDEDAMSSAQDTLEAEFSPEQASALISAMKVVCAAAK